jgi:hypothetical protein
MPTPAETTHTETKVSYVSMASKPRMEQTSKPSLEIDKSGTNTSISPNVPFETKKISYASMALKPAVKVLEQTQDKRQFNRVQYQNEQSDSQRTFKTKVFNRNISSKPTEIVEKKELPEHYIPRPENDNAIQFNAPEFIRRVAGAEKSSSDAKKLYHLLGQYAIEFFSQPNLMMNTTFFREKLTTESEDREKVFLLILAQVIALIIHRLIKSDSDKFLISLFELFITFSNES